MAKTNMAANVQFLYPSASRINSVGDPLRIQRMTDHDIDQGDQRTDQVDQDTVPVGQYCGQYV